jgi:tetratricopeptide (TPR) repeat protein
MNQLPKVHSAHIQEKKSYQALENILPKDLFIIREEVGGDYGVDRIIEVVQDGYASNIRSHIQLKSIKNSSSNDVIKFPVPLKTINYLKNSAASLFFVYSEADDCLYWQWVDKIYNNISSTKKLENKTFNYKFKQKLTSQSILEIHGALINYSSVIQIISNITDPQDYHLLNQAEKYITYKDVLLHFAKGDFHKAISVASNIEGEFPDKYFLISISYHRLGLLIQALEYAFSAEALSEDVGIKRLKAVVLCDIGTGSRSRENILKAQAIMDDIGIDNFDWLDFYNYANILSGLDYYDEAEKFYLKSIRLEPNYAEAWKNYSSVFRHRKDYKKELEHINKSLELNPKLIEALVSKALCILNISDDIEQATQLFETALSHSKGCSFDSSYIYYYLGNCYREAEDYQRALDCIEKGRVFYPMNQRLEDSYIYTNIEAGRTVPKLRLKAILVLKSYEEKYPKDPFFKAEQFNLLSIENPIEELIPLIQSALDTYDLKIEKKYILSMSVEQITRLLSNAKNIYKYRSSNSVYELFSQPELEGFPSEVINKLECEFDMLFVLGLAEFNTKEKLQSENAFQIHGEKFLDLLKVTCHVAVQPFSESDKQEKVHWMSTMLTYLPEIFLVELSRQIGYLASELGLGRAETSVLHESSDWSNEWFHLCIKPMLVELNKVLKLLPE